MPGLVGVVSVRSAGEAEARFGAALERMRRHPNQIGESVTALEGRCHVGRVQLAPAGGTITTSLPAVSAPAAFFHGVLYNAADLRSLNAACERAEDTDALISALYLTRGDGFVAELQGEFALALVDPGRRQLIVATDPVGSYPIRWQKSADGFCFSSDLSAVIRAGLSEPRIDLRAVADYLTIGAVLGDKTLAADVKELDAGTILKCDLQAGTVSLVRYSRLDELFQPKASDRADYVESVQSAFTQAVACATRTERKVGLSLSGGLDSRAILSAASGRGTALTTYTLGVEGCADQAIASSLSNLAGTTHHFFRLDSRYLRDFLPNMAAMVSGTDGLYLSHGLTEMLALDFLQETGIEVLLRGHGGELAKAHLAWPLHTDAHVYTLPSAQALVPYLATRANYVTPGLELGAVLTPEAAQAAGRGSSESFRSALSHTSLSAAEACSFLYLSELHRRFTIPSLELFRTRVDVRQPFVDTRFLRALLAAPPEWRDSTAIHRHLTSAGNPALLGVRNSNTGARADAGPRTEFVFDKLNTILKRLNVPGYRHYHDFDAWMRKALLESVESELIGHGARIQSFVSADTIRRMVRLTATGAANHGLALQVLLILELWQRENGVAGP